MGRVWCNACISAEAHLDLAELAVEMWPYAALAARVWDLRANMTGYDASYVAVAEAADATLVTLNQHLARSPGISCRIAVAP